MRSSRLLVLAGLIPVIALSACSRSDNASELGASVDRLATQAAPSEAAPAAEAPAALGPAVSPVAPPPQPVIYTDPKSASCGAPGLTSFIGQADSPAVREQIEAAAKSPGGIRFAPPGSAATTDYRTDRLNVMIDVTGVIRDLRCG
ncbi:MAG: I78 family peptidase inhibitor [Novosphingobium sp.]|nr:hypothetical protein [Novosphingobium sp.]